MYISQETAQQTHARLQQVIQTARLELYDAAYCFKEVPLHAFSFHKQALAMVRDNEVWSFLIPATQNDTENFSLFRFHFQPGIDNSGFVGWLAGQIKERVGSGVFVICGQNSNNGGIFDYWGCPVQVSAAVMALVQELRA